MKTLKQHENVYGIYCIRNIINDKKYIGHSINIRQRVSNHIHSLNAKNKHRENQFFINDWHQHSRKNFEYFILEIIDKNSENLKNLMITREKYWQDLYKSTDLEKGYNLRQDSENGMTCHNTTIIKMKDSNMKRYDINTQSGLEQRRITGERSSVFWEENPDKKISMIKKVSDKHTRFEIHQYLKNGKTLVKIWYKLKDILLENPNYKVHNIYAVCSGEKPSMYGFKWFKVLKNDIVQLDGDILDNG